MVNNIPFEKVTRTNYNLITNKPNNKMYFIGEDQMINTISQITTIIKYAIINYRETDETLIKSMRHGVGEQLVLPAAPILEAVATSNDKTYKYFKQWQTPSGSALSTYTTATTNTTYYASRINVVVPVQANINMTGEGESNQEMLNNQTFNLTSDINIYLKNTSYLGYIIKPTITRTTVNSKIVHAVSFKIQNLVNNPGQTTTLNPVFTIYKDTLCTEALGEANFTLNIYHPSQPTGD